MLIRPRLAFLFLVAALVSSAVAAPAPASEQQERIAVSFVLTQGRTPTAPEVAQWTKPEARSVAVLLAQHREQLQADPASQRAVTIRAFQDAFGRAPTADEIKAASAGGGTYTAQLKQHLQRLAEHPAEYEQVLHRVYQFLLHRDAYSLEIDYWKPRGSLSYALLVACVDDWARRNQPGLMVTSGVPTVSVNCRYLATVRLSPTLAAEVRAAAGLAPVGDPSLAIAAGRNLVAPGAESISSSGSIHFVAAGAADLVW